MRINGIASYDKMGFTYFSAKDRRNKKPVEYVPNDSTRMIKYAAAVGIAALASALIFTLRKGKSSAITEQFRTFKLSAEDFPKEYSLASYARKIGVSTPEICEDGSYKVFGNMADALNNPIKSEHLENIFDNLLLMDKNKLIHGDLEKSHVFYSPNSMNVEFDCFRFGFLFEEGAARLKREFPQSIYPSNAFQYEGNCIGAYLSELPSEDARKAFSLNYLVLSSKFHAQRAEYLIDKANNNQIKYEKLQADLFKNPDDNLIKLFRQRTDFKYKDRLAFTEWDEGFGACGNKIDEKRTTDAVVMYFDVIKSNIEYLKSVKNLKNSNSNQKIKEYLKFEEEYGQHWLNNYTDSTKGMAEWTMNPENSVNKLNKNVSQADKDAFSQIFNEFSSASSPDEKMTLINKCKILYQKIIK